MGPEALVPWQPSRDGHKTKQEAGTRLDVCKHQISIRGIIKPTITACVAPAAYSMNQQIP